MNVLVSYRSRRACANCTCSSIMMQGADSPKHARVVPMPAKAGRSSRVDSALKAKTGMTPCRRGCNPSPDDERGEKEVDRTCGGAGMGVEVRVDIGGGPAY